MVALRGTKFVRGELADGLYETKLVDPECTRPCGLLTLALLSGSRCPDRSNLRAMFARLPPVHDAANSG